MALWVFPLRVIALQSEPLLREGYIDKPVAEFELNPGQCLQLLKPLYGRCEAGDLWHATLDKHHRHDLEMTPFRIDPALYYLLDNGNLRWLSGSYVDDLIRSGDQHFRKISEATGDKFEISEDSTLPSEFTGFVIDLGQEGFFYIDQNAYLQKLECLPRNCSFEIFVRCR